MNRRTRTLLPLALAGSLALAACGGNATGQTPESDSGKLRVVTSTTVYADLVSTIGGDAVEATAVIDSLAQDPHSYEATSRDKLALSKAQLVVANGGGYDAFMELLAADLKLSDDTMINAVDTSPLAAGDDQEHDEAAHADEADHAKETDSHEGHGHEGHGHGAYNEHVWYDLESMRLLTEEIATRLAVLKPEEAATFTSNAAALVADLQGLEKRVESLRSSLEHKQFAMTEPVPYHLLTDLGLEDATPEGLSASIEGGGEVSPKAFNKMGELFESDAIDVLAYNTQTESPQTERIRALAAKANVPVVDFTETLPQDSDYVSWMNANISALEALAS